jgi:hypothetical protein
MNMKTCVALVAAGLLAACGGSGTDSVAGPGQPVPAGITPVGAGAGPVPEVAALMLAKEPAGAIGVVAAKGKGAADQVVVTGRVASLVPGYAVMKLMDLSLPYCGEVNKEDKCKTPWDWCCDTAATQTANSMLVEARDASGKPLATPSLGDVRLLDHVTATGKLVRDEHGNFTLVATGWHRVARPTLPDHVQWPQ